MQIDIRQSIMYRMNVAVVLLLKLDPFGNLVVALVHFLLLFGLR